MLNLGDGKRELVGEKLDCARSARFPPAPTCENQLTLLQHLVYTKAVPRRFAKSVPTAIDVADETLTPR